MIRFQMKLRGPTRLPVRGHLLSRAPILEKTSICDFLRPLTVSLNNAIRLWIRPLRHEPSETRLLCGGTLNWGHRLRLSLRGELLLLRRSIALSTLLGCVLCFSGVASAQSPAPATSPNSRSFESRGGEFVTAETQKAIDRGIVFLANRQHDDGWYFANNYKRNVAVTALAGMTFLSAGHVPGRGPYGKKVDKSVEYILSCVSPSGFIKRDDSPEHGPMYGHGFATLFLAEVYGMSPNREIRESLKAATQLIVNSQNKEGGWRYKPDGRDADVSVTVCQMMALRAARNCGIAVPKTTVDNCVEYIRKCQNSDGGFRYRLGDRPLSEFPRSAAGVVVLYNAGVTDGRDLERGLAYLVRFPPRGDLVPHNPHYFYGQYYAAQAMWHAGEDNWRQWYPAIRDELLIRQGPDGGWSDQINDVYGTSMACLILQMPNNLLPIFQR